MNDVASRQNDATETRSSCSEIAYKKP